MGKEYIFALDFKPLVILDPFEQLKENEIIIGVLFYFPVRCML